ncbi:MAG: hypothetical protein WDO12_11975 [Pseudomonadota bacterium]
MYLPFTADTLDPQFVTGGKDYLLATRRRAIADLRAAHAPSMAYPGQSLADVVPPEVITHAGGDRADRRWRFRGQGRSRLR